MESPQLHALGFDFDTTDDLVKAAFAAGVRGSDSAPGFSLLGAYTDSSGARLSFVQRTDQAASITAGLQSGTVHRAQVVRFTDLLARVALYGSDADGELLTQFVAAVDDPIAYAQHDLRDDQFSLVHALQVGAAALDIEVFADEAAFEASPTSEVGSMRVTPASLLSPSLLGLQAGAIHEGEATPTLLMGMVVQTVEIRRNELSGVEFQYVTGRSVVDITAAIPLEHPVEPGNVVYGTFYGTVNSGSWD